jgi:mitogen-activated protein kinase organizer 1
MRLKSTLNAHTSNISSITYSLTGDYILTSSTDTSLKIHKASNKTCIQTLASHTKAATDAALSPTNTHIASSSIDKSLILWDVSTGTPVKKYIHPSGVTSVCFNGEGNAILSGSSDTAVRIWDVRSRNCVQVLDEGGDDISCVTATPTLIASTCLDGSLRMYDIRAGMLHTDKFSAPLTRACIDASCVLVSGLDSLLRLVDLESGKELKRYSGHVCKDYRLGTAFSADGARVIGGSADGKGFVWDLVSGNLVYEFSVGSAVVGALDSHPKLQEICTGDATGVLKVWDME